MKNIIVSKKVHNYLLRAHELTGNKHELAILKLIKDSKEYRKIKPDATYPEPLKWKTQDLPRVEISDGTLAELIKLHADGCVRINSFEYSAVRIMNDLLHDSEELNKMQQEAYKEIDDNGNKI